MGRRGNKWSRKPSKKTKQEWKCKVIPEEHQLFKQYYQQQLKLDPQDFKDFWDFMKVKLPVVFRINPNSPNYEAFKAKIKAQDFIQQITPAQLLQELSQKKDNEVNKEILEEVIGKKQEQAFQPTELCKFELIDWYPGDIVYSLNTTKQMFKKSRVLAHLHSFLQKCFDSGLVSRQELVSMIPPLYLNIQPNDVVLDMCAAPGSKTSQLLEMMHKERRELTKGCVVANDADYSRAQMLIHQLHRSGTAGMAVINHPGQFMPELHVKKVGSIKKRFQFDKILCDVPCSGDGATRKLPIKWATWHTTDGQVLHPLQLSILMKGVKLLKKDGLLVYSTCSLNPIENEAVINALLQRVERGLELMDIHTLYGIKGRRGLKRWGVYAIVDDKGKEGDGTKDVKLNDDEVQSPEGDPKKAQEQKVSQKNEKAPKIKYFSKKCLKQFASYEQAKDYIRIKPSMFPSEQERNLDYTMRILPHDQNSGGFFVALLHKKNDFQWKYGTHLKQEIGAKTEQEIQDKFVEQHMGQVSEIPKCIDQEEGIIDHTKLQEKEDSEGEKKEEQINEKQETLQKQAKQEEQQQGSKENKSGLQKKKVKVSKYECFEKLNEEQFLNIQKFYGLDESFRELLYVRDNLNARKKVLLVSDGIRNFLGYDSTGKIKLVNMGCQVFERGKQSFAGVQCRYRLCQEGIHFILDHFKYRKIKVSISFFRQAISIRTLSHDQIQDKDVRQAIGQMTQGSFCLYIDEEINGNRVVDALVGQNFKSSLQLMISKEDTASFAIRYL